MENNLLCFKRTPILTALSLPKIYKEGFFTESGVWTKLIIIKGKMKFAFLNLENKIIRRYSLNSKSEVELIKPLSVFKITPNSTDLQFNLEFYCSREDYFYNKYNFNIQKRIVMRKEKFKYQYTYHILPYIYEGRLKLKNEKGEIVNTARCHIVLPPACDFPQITIAKKTTSLTTLDIIQSSGSMNLKMKEFVKLCLKCNLTTVLSGASGAGKTTFTEAMTKEWPMGIRIGVAEDSPELNLLQENTTYLKSAPRQPGQDIKDEANLDWCVQQLNRMRVDKIIVGETRSKEFFYFLQAANSGCEGSLTTIHASDPRMCLQKMTQFSVMAMPQPIRVANKNIASTVDIIIQLVRLLDGRYRVHSIEEVSNTLGNDDNAAISTTVLAKFDEKTDTWTDSFSLMTDNLRKKIEANGYNSQTFQKKGILE